MFKIEDSECLWYLLILKHQQMIEGMKIPHCGRTKSNPAPICSSIQMGFMNKPELPACSVCTEKNSNPTQADCCSYEKSVWFRQLTTGE